MENRKIDAIIKDISKLDNEEYIVVAKEVNKGLIERGIVKPKANPLGRRFPFRF